MLKGL